MIIIIILLTLLIVGLTLFLVSANMKTYCDDKKHKIQDNLFTASLILLFPGGILSCVFGSISFAVNSPMYCTAERVKYEERVTELNTTYNYLMTYDNETLARYTAIQQYNTEVREFKTDILEAQTRLKNPWLNWLECREYKNMNVDAVKYIGI